jgi:hypothetical protein
MSGAPPSVKPNQKPKPDTTYLVNGMSSGFAAGVVTKGKPMSLEEQKQKKKKGGGIF